MTRDQVSKALSLIQHIKALAGEKARFRAENAELRAALERVRQGYRNLLDLRIQQYDGRAHLTREEITEELRRVESILDPQVANNATNPPETPAESATGDGSAGDSREKAG